MPGVTYKLWIWKKRALWLGWWKYLDHRAFYSTTSYTLACPVSAFIAMFFFNDILLTNPQSFSTDSDFIFLTFRCTHVSGPNFFLHSKPSSLSSEPSLPAAHVNPSLPLRISSSRSPPMPQRKGQWITNKKHIKVMHESTSLLWLMYASGMCFLHGRG